MKKLLIYTHLDEKIFEADVYVEGNDFIETFIEPKPIWLGRVMLVDKEPELESPERFVSTIDDVITEVESKPEEFREVSEIIEDIKEGTSKVEEVIDEPEKVDNKDNGDRGIDEAKQPKSIETVPDADTGDNTPKRSKGTRKRKKS